MTYTLDGNKLLFAIDRTRIVDIAVDDILTLDGFDGVQYVWTDHDADFFENNPDAEVFLQLEQGPSGKYQATEVIVRNG